MAWAPGAFELPLVARAFATAGKVDAVLCLGAVVRGDTGHYDFVAGQCAAGILDVALTTGVPVVFGVLTTDTLDQALERSEPDHTNKGRESALTGIEMVRLLRSGRSPRPADAAVSPLRRVQVPAHRDRGEAGRSVDDQLRAAVRRHQPLGRLIGDRGVPHLGGPSGVQRVAVAMTTSPSRALDKKLALHSTVVKLPPPRASGG